MLVHLFNSSSVSGPERLVAPALAALPDDPVVVNLREDRIPRLRASDPLEDYCRALGVPYRAVSVAGRWDPPAIAALGSLLERLSPSLVHAHDAKASIYLAAATGGGAPRRFPLVTTHHGVHGRPDWTTRLYEWVYRRRFLPLFDRVLAVSTADHAFLLESGIGGGSLRLHLNGADARLVTEEERPARSRRARADWLPHDPGRDGLFLMGAVGRLSKEKDHARLLRFLCRLKRGAEREWRCLVFGSGPLEAPLRRLSARLGLEKNVVWMGYRKEVADELSGLDLLLSFSKAEGLPISLIEAGWAGTPVLATEVGGVTDLLPDHRHGLRVPPSENPADTARRYAFVLSGRDLEWLRERGQRFQERVRARFTRERWLERLYEIYSELGAAASLAPAREEERIAVPN